MSYTAPAGQIGKGTAIAFTPNTGTAPTFAKVVKYKPNKVAMGKAEVTTFADTAERFIPNGFVNGGTYTFNILSQNTVAAATFAVVGTQGTLVITLPDTHTWTLTGFIESYEQDIPIKDKITDEIVFLVDGDPVYA